MSITIVQALEDPRLLGALPRFRNLTSWRAWIVVLKSLYGLALDEWETRWFCQHTGRTRYAPPEGGYRTLVLAVGRQSGKSAITGLIADYESVFGDPADGGQWIIAVAQDHRASVRTMFSYINEPFEEVPALKGLVAGKVGDVLELRSGVKVGAYPCRPAAVRGPSARLAIIDEAAWLRNSEGVSQDRELMRALDPTLAMGGPMVGGRRLHGRLVLLSSPAGQSGMFYDTFERHWGRDDSEVLVVQATAMEMNSLLGPDYMARMREDDPEGYAAEALGQFRGGMSALLDPVAVRASVQKGRVDLPPAEGAAYAAHMDASSGRNDHYVVSVGHRDGDRIVVDVVRAWKAGANFSTRRAAAEAAELLRPYGVREVTGDGYAIGFVIDDFRHEGIEFKQIEKPGTKPDTKVSVNTSELMLDLVNPLHSGIVLLPDSPELVAELIALERRRSSVAGVRDRVVVPPGRHKDAATAVSGVVYRLREAPRRRKLLEGLRFDPATGGTTYLKPGERPKAAAPAGGTCKSCLQPFREEDLSDNAVHRACGHRAR